MSGTSASWDFAGCADLAQVLSTLRIRKDAAKSASGDEAEALAWRLASLERVLTALSRSHMFADRGVLLREAARLCDNYLVLPLAGLGLGEGHLPLLHRFGLGAHTRGEGTREVVLDLRPVEQETHVPAELASPLKTALQLDPGLRRFRQADTPDGVLLRLSDHRSYQNPTQKAAVRALLTMPEGATLLVSMATGGGKSLLFQLGVRWWRERASDERPCAVVIVPTVALALAHEKTLKTLPGLEGSAALVGTMSASRKEDILLAFRQGEIPILLLSPESALNSARATLLRAALPNSQRYSAERGHLEGFFVDEAHIIDSWGRSFRPDFQRLSSLVQELRGHNSALRTVLLSATIGTEARKLLEQQYTGSGPFLSISAACPRTELDLVTHQFPSATDRNAALLRLVDLIPRPAIVYTTEVEEAEGLVAQLRDKDYGRVEAFTGSTDSEMRSSVVNRWHEGELDLVVATSAFGMGIDVRDVRAVVHACMPEDSSRYYQEIGRAGRDGHQSLGLLLWTPEDAETARGMALGQLMSMDTAVPRWRAIVEDSRRRGIEPEPSTGHPVLVVDLDVPPPGKSRGSYTRRWNASLLNQLQRYGAARILSVDDQHFRWKIVLTEPLLLDEGEQANQRLLEILRGRADEVREAGERFKAFLQCLETPDEDCLLGRVFEMVEAGRPFIEQCGRCPHCRNHEVEAPRSFQFKGTGQIWSAPASPDGGCYLIYPESEDFSAPENLLRRLVGIGVGQFVVPAGLGASCSQLLKGFKGSPGLVLESPELSRIRKLARIPTALLLGNPGADATPNEEFLQRLRDEERLGDVGLFVVASPDLRIGGRQAGQVVSKHAPMVEARLDDWRGSRR